MEYVNDQNRVMTSEEQDLVDELYEVLHRAWMGWVRQQPETLQRDYGKNHTVGLNVFTRLLAYLLVDAISLSLSDCDGDGFDPRTKAAAAKCHSRIVTVVCQDVVPAVRKDLKQMGLNCDGAEVLWKVCGLQPTS